MSYRIHTVHRCL